MTSDDLDPRAELASLAGQARGLLELDRLLGVTCSPVPALPPLVRRAPAPAPAKDSPQRQQRQQMHGGEDGPRPSSIAPAVSAVSVVSPPELDAIRKEHEAKLEVLARRMAGCTKCRLSEGRTQLVFGQGDAAAEIVFVGEGPGYHEDQEGLAFVGKAGELLTKMIVAMGLTRDEVFIANCVKCRPPENRQPAGDEMATCLPFLKEQLEIIQPKVIVALGKTAGTGLGLIRADDGLGKNRGRFHEWKGIPVMLTYHPAYLLRTPGDKRKAWEDLQKVLPLVSRRRA